MLSDKTHGQLCNSMSTLKAFLTTFLSCNMNPARPMYLVISAFFFHKHLSAENDPEIGEHNYLSVQDNMGILVI